MKRVRVFSIIALAVALSLLAPALLTVPATAITAEELAAQFEKDPVSQQEMQNLKMQMLAEDEINRWALERQKTRQEAGKPAGYTPKQELKDFTAAFNVGIHNYAKVQSVVNDIVDGGEFSVATAVNTVYDLASDIAAACGPIGALIGGAFELRQQLFNAFMGGTEPKSELATLQDSMQEGFSELSDEIFEVNRNLGALSDEISESTNAIIKSFPNALDDFGAREELKKFLLRTEGNFSYDQYRNIIYGDIEGNSSSDTAYYAQLMRAIEEDASEDVVRHYYDALYSSLTDGYDAYRDYIVGSDGSKSIVQNYYSVVSKRPDLLGDTSPEMAAVSFAYDLYETQFTVDKIRLVCNEYQYTRMLLEGKDRYEGDGVFVNKASIESGDVARNIELREQEIRLQLAKDLASILQVNKTVVMQKDARMYTAHVQEQGGTVYLPVLSGQTVYLNRLPQSVCEEFDLRADGFVYSVGELRDQSGVISVDRVGKHAVITLQYKYQDGDSTKYETIATLHFLDGEKTDFAGGSGTAADPYLIATADQFEKIKVGLDKYYRLVQNIDFKENSLKPFGYYEANETVKSDAFTGVLDGNGYALQNLTVENAMFAGVFGKIGARGVVKDLTLQNVHVKADFKTGKNESNKSFYVGVLAAQNEGCIQNCTILNSSATLNAENTHYSCNVNVYVGGFSGYNSGRIVGCFLEKTAVSLESTHDFAGDPTYKNLHHGYAGGIAGYNIGYVGYCAVHEDSTVKAKVTSKLSPEDSVAPYVDAYAGGIVGKLGSEDALKNIVHVYSDVTGKAEGELEVYESRYGKHYANRVQCASAYVAGVDDGKVSKDSIDGIRSALVAKEYTVEAKDVPMQTAGSGGFLQGDMFLCVNNVTVDKDSFSLLAVYGFNSDNAGNLGSDVTRKMTALTAVELAGDYKYFAIPVEYTVGPDFVERIEAKAIQTVYVQGETVGGEDVWLELYYACGDTKSIVADIGMLKNADTVTQELGKATIEVNYAGFTAFVEVEVVCENCAAEQPEYTNEEKYNSEEVKPTCYNSGYVEYTCKKCNAKIKTNYQLPLATHTVVRETLRDATCLEEGTLGKVYCSSCGDVFYEGGVIPREPHVYKINKSYSDWEDYHYCENGEHKEEHQYVITEEASENGVLYVYTCHVCKYVDTEMDTNVITDESGRVAQVVVSDGFALQGGDLVTVYVQLVNNPGVIGAQFGVRYDPELELVGEPEEGTVFEHSLAQDSASVSCGYNFIWANIDSNERTEDGNLLKLVFKTPAESEKDSFLISVVYNGGSEKISEGGFGLSSDCWRNLGISSTEEMQQFLTKDGYVHIVDHLPGDVNNDGTVDMLDALYLCSFAVEREKPSALQCKYGDMNLDGKIGLADVLAVLRTLYGGDGLARLYHKYKLALNYNGGGNTEFVDVALYDDKGNFGMTYADAGVKNPEREGYKFLGWYYTLADKEGNSSTPVDLTEGIVYNRNQKQQMLYARWEKNSVSFNMNGATSGQIGAQVYTPGGNNVITLREPSESYGIKFIYEATGASVNGTLSQSFAEWTCGEQSYCAEDMLDLGIVGFGSIELMARWNNDWRLEYTGEPLTRFGYMDSIEEITWCYDKYTTEEVDRLEDITVYANKDTMGKNYTLYAKWNHPIEYNIQYALDGGAFENAPQEANPESAKYDDAFLVTVPKKTGYTFAGWTIKGMDTDLRNKHLMWDDKGHQLSEEQTIDELSNIMYTHFQNLHSVNGATVTFTAKWTPNTYSIMYVGNGGDSGYTADSEHTYDEPKTLTANEFRRAGYTFVGWNTDKAASIALYEDREEVTNLSTDKETVILYAIWALNTNFTLTQTDVNRVVADEVIKYEISPDFSKTDLLEKGYTHIRVTVEIKGIVFGMAVSGSRAYAQFRSAAGGRITRVESNDAFFVLAKTVVLSAVFETDSGIDNDGSFYAELGALNGSSTRGYRIQDINISVEALQKTE